jgi:hypothetical protein
MVLVALILATSCGSAAEEPVAKKPAVEISYFANFADQVASGYLNLIVDVTVHNKGLSLFNVSPDKFNVIVKEYSYPVIKSNLISASLKNGEGISGQLTFQVPPEAATTRVGYRMLYTGQDNQKVEWVKIASQTTSETTTADFTPVILISYAEGFMWTKETSTLYMLVEMTIENRGYESFNTSPQYFTLILGDIFGEPGPYAPIPFDGELSDQRDEAYSDLRSYDLQNGGKINGTLAFKVPTFIFKATEPCKINYSGLRTYNIQWKKLPPIPMNSPSTRS